MTDVHSLFTELRAAGVKLWLHEGALRYWSPEPLPPALLSAMRAAKAEIIDALGTERNSLASRSRPKRVPLSLAQEGLWYIDQQGTQDLAYNVRTDLRLEGELDVAALRCAVQELVDRHESLRTRYVSEDGIAYQMVDPPREFPVPLTDLSELSPEAGAGQLATIRTEHDDHRFDLAAGPLLLVHLVRMAPAEHVLIVCAPHVGIDGPSTAIKFSELDVLYRAHAEGRPSPLPPPVAQYVDYTLWQREWAASPDYERQLRYWKGRLDGAAPLLDMPTDRSRPVVPTQSGDVVRFSLPPDLTARLAEFRLRHDATLFTVLLAAFHAALFKWTRQSDISVGLPVDARGHDDAASLIGYFINTVVLRSTIEPDTTFVSLLSSVRANLAAAYDHRNLPIARLVAELSPARKGGGHPLFQVMFAYLSPGEHRLGDLRVSQLDTGERTAKFDLTFIAGENEYAGLEYSTELFERSTIEALAEGILATLDQVTREPEIPLGELSLVPDNRIADRIAELSAVGESLRDESCLHHLVERTARRTPNATALVHGDQRVSYAELNRAANGVAALLRERGVGPDQLVGVCLGRSVTMVVALLGVLKAGGAYVPLDPEYPPARLQAMLDDSRARVVVSDSHAAVRLGPHTAELLLVDEPISAAVDDVDGGALPSNAAYCLYTSGSTGRPKGVVMQHDNAVSFVRWAGTRFTEEDLEKVLFGTSISFDLSVFELFAPLTVGGTVVIADSALDVLESPVDVSLLNVVPSVGRELADAGRIPPGVRVVNLAGEPLRGELIADIRRVAAQTRINNLYGPTEYTTYATGREIISAERITIGHPLPGTQALVLDEGLRPVAVGSVGELYLSGAGLARGYWSRPDLTADRFMPNPYGPQGSRMYRTGDLVRSLAGGEIDFRGRIDHQVKLRGFRVELGEIEAVLLDSPHVKDAVVVAGSAGTENARLIAYVVADRDTEADLSRKLADELPAFMAPSTMVFLDELPLTANGKVDRLALPCPAVRVGERSAPRTDLEAVLLEIWRSVLGVEEMGISDNFFEAGGHSLLATRVLSQVRRTTGIRLSLLDILTAPTVAELAEAVADKTVDDPRGPSPDPFAPVLPIKPSGGRPPLFCVHAALGLSLPYVGLAAHLGAERPIFGLQSPAIGAHVELPRSIEDIADEYLGRIRETHPSGPYHLLGWSFGALLAFEIAVRLQAAGEEVASLALVDGYPAVVSDPAPTEREVLVSFLEHAGIYDAESDLTAVGVLDRLRQQKNKLTDVGGERLERVLAVMRNNALLAQQYVPTRFTGPVRLFISTSGVVEAEVRRRAEEWEPHVKGAIRVRRLGARHENLMDPQPLSEIAAVLLSDHEHAEH